MKPIGCLICVCLLSGCADQVNQLSKLVTAHEDGYQWAELHAKTLSVPDCDLKNARNLQEEFLAKGCLQYLEEHPEVKNFKRPKDESVGEVRVSDLQSPAIRPEASEKDFELGYQIAASQYIASVDECEMLQGSYRFVNGCKQYVTETIISSEENDEDVITPEMETDE